MCWGRRPEEGDILPVSKFCLRKCWVKKFSDVPQCKSFFLKGTTPNLPGILVGGIFKNEDRYKPICQKYKNFYRFATLYDTFNRIPVFSAYTFTGNTTGRPIDRWMIEPGLEGVNRTEMQIQEGGSYKHQAEQKDYKNSKYRGVNRGHLFPSSHAHDLDTQKSTFTLTNIVPQVVSFNDGSWKTMERNVRGTLKLNCKDANDQIKAYVVTGAVPNNNKTKLNNRVNIPYLMWTAYCCENKKYKKNKKWMAGAYWGENKKGTGALDQQTLGALEIMLNRYYKGKDGPVKVFPEDCPRGPKPTTSS
ncbi:endonuclease domain-containing 1 protein-like isoform X2 [Salvelinus fontinalis]|uniref:endonuclease domain-containing 1 protein-like isoform X2 n=1 Tax=Salvelinus fontinalis TaxID=8038 RepID=UPI0024861C82|nr:endonuclease domain-containing 1 protein-like isoform X2 [Salvelinus fontinalis]XP_055768701.1 endonuclease domain-containing 1 protein-like isoform X2 [Salvelinus fontinalis]